VIKKEQRKFAFKDVEDLFEEKRFLILSKNKD